MISKVVEYVEVEERYLDKWLIFRRIAFKFNFGRQYKPFYWIQISAKTATGTDTKWVDKFFDLRLHLYGWYIQFIVATIKG